MYGSDPFGFLRGVQGEFRDLLLDPLVDDCIRCSSGKICEIRIKKIKRMAGSESVFQRRCSGGIWSYKKYQYALGRRLTDFLYFGLTVSVWVYPRNGLFTLFFI